MNKNMQEIRLYPAAGLRKLGCAIFEGAGCDRDEAQIVSDHLVAANLAGHDSHGVKMISKYMENMEKQGLFCNVPLDVIHDTGGIMAFDGGLGYGQRLAREATDIAITRCQENGSIIWSLRNAHHVGRIGAYGEQVIDAGLVGLFFVNVVGHDPTVAPYGGRASRFGTNPICIAIPGGSHGAPLLLDFATSRIAYGKVEVARNKGVSVPDGTQVDNNGDISTDPNVMFDEPKGAQLTFGDHKGSGLALMCEVLAGALSGGFTIQPGNERRDNIINNMFSLLIRPDALPGGGALAGEVERLVTYVKDTPLMQGADEVLIAGEPEMRARTERLRDGIPLDAVTWENVLTSAEQAGVSRSRAHELVFHELVLTGG